MYPVQFGLMANGAGTDYLMQQLGQLPPRDLLWAFMEGSRSYQVAAGVAELVGGFLLLTRGTAMWGAFLSAASMANVLMLDIGYDVVVKFLAGQIFLLAVFVAAPYAKGLGAVLASHAAHRTPASVVPPARPRWHRMAWISAVAISCFLVWWTYRDSVTSAFASAPARTPLHGIWDVEEVSRAGVAVPLLLTDSNQWRRLVLPFGGTDAGAMVVWMSDAVTRCPSRIDTQAKTLTIEPAVSTVVGSVRPGPQAHQRMRFQYALAPNDGLLLRGSEQDGAAVVIRLKRFDHSKYQLLAHRRGWWW